MRARQRLRGGLRRLHRLYVRYARGFTAQDLLAGLRAVGLHRGDVVLVHVSNDQLHGFRGTPSDVIRVVQQAVEPQGTLLMPTIPFRGSAIEYVQNGPMLDIRRTPSRMGLITELFRRSPNVRRSVHPTHPVAAWGARADELTAGHERAGTPCGRGSPYHRLLEWNGKVLLLGTGIGAMTFFHSVEEELEAELPFSPFTGEIFHVRCRDATGTITTVETRLYDPEYSRLRNLDLLEAELRHQGWWSERGVGGARLVLLEARMVLDAVRSMASRGLYCYDQ